MLVLARLVHLKKKAEWRKGVGEHSVQRERHGVYCEGQRVWNWRYKGFKFVIQTGSKENMRTIPPQNRVEHYLR
jgi:hypothetical protein